VPIPSSSSFLPNGDSKSVLYVVIYARAITNNTPVNAFSTNGPAITDLDLPQARSLSRKWPQQTPNTTANRYGLLIHGLWWADQEPRLGGVALSSYCGLLLWVLSSLELAERYGRCFSSRGRRGFAFRVPPSGPAPSFQTGPTRGKGTVLTGAGAELHPNMGKEGTNVPRRTSLYNSTRSCLRTKSRRSSVSFRGCARLPISPSNSPPMPWAVWRQQLAVWCRLGAVG